MNKKEKRYWGYKENIKRGRKVRSPEENEG